MAARARPQSRTLLPSHRAETFGARITRLGRGQRGPAAKSIAPAGMGTGAADNCETILGSAIRARRAHPTAQDADAR